MKLSSRGNILETPSINYTGKLEGDNHPSDGHTHLIDLKMTLSKIKRTFEFQESLERDVGISPSLKQWKEWIVCIPKSLFNGDQGV